VRDSDGDDDATADDADSISGDEPAAIPRCTHRPDVRLSAIPSDATGAQPSPDGDGDAEPQPPPLYDGDAFAFFRQNRRRFAFETISGAS
jgi:hypothetical protein